jgi:hypothetical protein
MDLNSVCKTLYEREWERLNALLPPIPHDFMAYIPDDHTFAHWGLDDIKHAVRLRNDAIARARRRKELDHAMPVLPDASPS